MTGLIEQEPYLKIKKLFDGKKFDEIITYCQKLLVKDPKNKLALQNISTAYNMVGGYQDAIQSSNKILEIDKTDEFALKNKMFANEKLENHDEVLICCEQILAKNKDDIFQINWSFTKFYIKLFCCITMISTTVITYVVH